jgi:hypothetical protein
LLLVAVIDLDVPPPEVILDHLLQRQIRISTDQVCRVPIGQPLIARGAVVQRFDRN